MPPRKAAAAKVAAPPPVKPLEGLTASFSGTFPKGRTHKLLSLDLADLGGTLSTNIAEDSTHLIASKADALKPSPKVQAALDRCATAAADGIADGEPGGKVWIVGFEWLEKCQEMNARVDESSYVLTTSAVIQPVPPVHAAPTPAPVVPDNSPTTSPTIAPVAPVAASRKRRTAAIKAHTILDIQDEDDPEDEVDSTPKKKAKPDSKSATKVVGVVSTMTDSKPPPKTVPTDKAPIRVPLDQYCDRPGFEVYIDPETSVIYDFTLNQTNAGNNNNKFYNIQLIHKDGEFLTWTRWGRVGEKGQHKMLGDGSFHSAYRELDKKFNNKTGLRWDCRHFPPNPRRYVYVERNYDESSDEEEDDNRVKQEVKKEEVKEEKEILPPIESKLHPAIQTLMGMIFDLAHFRSTFQDFNYDADKMPLGKLSKTTIQKGFQFLKNLSELIDQVVITGIRPPDYDIETQSNLFYSQIPHNFGRNRPPVIRTMHQLKKEVELLESLSDMKAASDIIKEAKFQGGDGSQIHPLDQKYNLLGMDEMTPLDEKSGEYDALKTYLLTTRGSTHDLQFTVLDIFRITRNTEPDRFITPSKFSTITKPIGVDAKNPLPGSNRRLLWHGSRSTNFGGILSQGLRIAPPEAPATGYMFGKGVYLADMASKSANYCCSHISDNVGLLLLCEAELGDPMLELVGADYRAGERAREAGKLATWGQGRTGPTVWKDASAVHENLKGIQMPDTKTSAPGPTGVEGGSLLYSEYICYDVSQIRLRYLFRVKMSHR